MAIAIWFIPAVGQYASAGMLEAASVGFVTGGIASGSLKGAAIGAFSAAAGAAVGGNGLTGASLFSVEGAQQLAIYGVIGGALSVMQGGKFGHGFVTAGLTRAATTALSGFETTATIGGVDMGQVAAHAVVGGTISDVTGGKFANGAVTGGFQALFSQLHRRGVASNEVAEVQEMTYEELIDRLKKAGVKIGDVKPSEKIMGRRVVEDPVFKDEANRIFEEALKTGSETEGIRVYLVNDDHLFATPVAGSPCENNPSPTCMKFDPIIPYSNWKRVLEWHPHPKSGSTPSPNDYITSSQAPSVIRALWYDFGKTVFYKGVPR